MITLRPHYDADATKAVSETKKQLSRLFFQQMVL